MQSKIITAFIAVSLSISMSAQKLSFNKEGEFKVVQFTDMHYVHGNPKSDTTLLLVPYILDSEKPDLVVFTGDIVTGSVEGWDVITKYVIGREIPFAVTLGNHDHENGVTRKRLLNLSPLTPLM